MVVGTTSHAGKSFLTTAICRVLARAGWRVTPFKGQNMALNAYVTEAGGEIGYAQAVQAWAAKAAPHVDMNPILLKPQGNMTSQVILMGKAVGVTSASQYYEQYFDRGWQAITASLDRLSQEFDYIVCEGAGSPAEINLKHRDLTNMRVAKYLNAPTLLVVDIDRGGAFAHVVGTLALLDPEERALVKGIVINKFRGQRSLLDSGIEWLENYTGIPVIGVIPWSEALFPAEDSLSLLEQRRTKGDRQLTLKILRLPHIANFTDFDPLEAEPSLAVEYLDLRSELGHPDAVIIPGSKTTLTDLVALHETGMAEQIKAYLQNNGVIMGICGGFQMLGQSVRDPDRLEGTLESYPGLGLLNLETTLTPDKILRQRQVKSVFPQADLAIAGYEIHQGVTRELNWAIDNWAIAEQPSPYLPLFDDASLGVINPSQTIWGSYLHGIFDNGAWRRDWINRLRHRRGLPNLPTKISNYSDQREAVIDELANLVTDYVDLSPLIEPLQ
jgi:adenosylcobyric acid synthase